jgi:Trypsin-like peptidase domain
MSVPRPIVLTFISFVALTFFGLGAYRAEMMNARQLAESNAKIDALRAQIARAAKPAIEIAGTSGVADRPATAVGADGRAQIVEEVKRQLQHEMGLLPLRLLRDRRDSFVELYAYDNFGKANYGTAGYLGDGYFVTVKHGVVALEDDDNDRREARQIESIKIMIKGKPVPAKLVDTGNADVEVHPGDWAIIRVKETVDLPPLTVNIDFAFDFADPIFRLGNDYSKGIILATGYIGQRTSNGLVTCLTDGHPGVSGGGVLDARGDLVGIPIGRMQGDYRFSFILPLRAEMFRRVPNLHRDDAVGSDANQQ